MTIGLLKEPDYETRVSLLPEHIALLKKMQATLVVEAGAGERSFASDEKYREAGATVTTRESVWQQG